MPFELDPRSGEWREYITNEQGTQYGGSYKENDMLARLEDARDRREAGLTGTVLGAPTYSNTAPEMASRAQQIAQLITMKNVAGIEPKPIAMAPELVQNTATAGSGAGAQGLAGRLMGGVSATSGGTYGYSPYTPMSIDEISQRARTIVDPQYAAKLASIQNQINAVGANTDSQRQNVEAAYTNSLADYQRESQNMFDTVNQQMGRAGLWGSGINQQNLIDSAAKYGLPQRLAALAQSKAGALSDIEANVNTQRTSLQSQLSNMSQEQASAVAAEIIRQQDAERSYGLQASQLAATLASQEASRKRQEEQTRLDALYKTADLTGVIPQGLAGAGGLTVDQQNKLAQLAISNTNATRPPTVSPKPQQEVLRDEMYVFLGRGMNPWDLPANHRREYDRVYGTIDGRPKTVETGVTDNSLLDMARRSAELQGIMPDSPEYEPFILETFKRLKSALGKGGGGTTTPKTDEPYKSPEQTPSTPEEIEDIINQYGVQPDD